MLFDLMKVEEGPAHEVLPDMIDQILAISPDRDMNRNYRITALTILLGAMLKMHIPEEERDALRDRVSGQKEACSMTQNVAGRAVTEFFVLVIARLKKKPEPAQS